MNNPFEGMVEEKLLNLHTAFIGKIISMEGDSLCSVQPLDKIKAYGQKPKNQSVITNVPILNHVRRYTLVKQTLQIHDTYSGGGSVTPTTHPTAENEGHIRIEPLRIGDIVLCVCVERDISSSIRGMSTTPPVGHHQLKDAIVIGLIGG
ncbi:MAG: hypothetical protein IKY67_06230 [Paludibacteraceae bacterium]|nr:hypothetical protein [Paludibacteraceae bacterium]